LFRSRIKVTSTIVSQSPLNISETVRDIEAWFQRIPMAYGELNGHVTDDVTWPRKVKFVTPTCLELNISKTAGNWDSVPKYHN